MQHGPAQRSAAPPHPRGRRVLGLATAAVLALGLVSTGAPLARAAAPSFCPDGTQPYATVAEVEALPAGTAVTGLSVTRGTTPEEFTGTYLGHVDDYLGKGRDVLLFRMASPVIDGSAELGLKPAGIWQGMSGSPVYTTDGRLIGAVAYGFNADNLPIAGVTPAEYMRNIGTTAVGTATRVRLTRTNLKVSPAGLRLAGTDLAGATLAPLPLVKVAGPAGRNQTAFTNRTLARTPKGATSAAFLRGRDFRAAAAESATLAAPLVAGGSVAATYTAGDVVVGGIGTVTAVCGDQVYAFGHPMNFVGATRMFMSNASIALVVPDATGTTGSYKLASAIGAPLGLITQDRYLGIRGTVGATSSLPVTVTVRNPAGAVVETYAGAVADPVDAAAATALLAGQAAYEQLDQYSAGTGEVSWTITYRRADGSTGSLRNKQLVSDATWFPDAIAGLPAEDAAAISGNAFEDVTVTGVAVTLRLLSADALSYRLSRIQVQDRAGAWKSLDGRTLTAGRTYTMRPRYTLARNGRPAGTVSGAAFTTSLRAKARKAGALTLVPARGQGEVCEDFGGITICEDFSDPGSGDYGSFDDLVAALADQPLASEVAGELSYRLVRGSFSRDLRLSGPGVVTGSAEAVFAIRR